MTTPDTETLLARIARLEAENADLKARNSLLAEEKSDLEMLMEMSADHADGVGQDLLDQAHSLKEMSNVILETVPAPIIVTRLADGRVLYLNQPCGALFGQARENLMEQKTLDFLYANPKDRERVLAELEKIGMINDFQLEGKRANGTPFVVRIFSRPLTFENEACILTVLYDETERKQAEEEIARLHRELENKKRELRKYLAFFLSGNAYGVSLPDVKEITGMARISRLPNAPGYMKGIIRLRDGIIPVIDLGQKLGLGPVQCTARTCIIIVEIEANGGKRPVGMIVEAVSEVIQIRWGDIAELPAAAGFGEIADAFKTARINDDVFMIIDIRKLFAKEILPTH